MADRSLVALWQRAALLLALLVASWLAPRVWLCDDSGGRELPPQYAHHTAGGTGAGHAAGLWRNQAAGASHSAAIRQGTQCRQSTQRRQSPTATEEHPPRRIDTRVVIAAANPGPVPTTGSAAQWAADEASRVPVLQGPALTSAPSRPPADVAIPASTRPEEVPAPRAVIPAADGHVPPAPAVPGHVPPARPVPDSGGEPGAALRPAVSRLVEYLEPLAFSSATRGWVAATLPHVERLPEAARLGSQPQRFVEQAAVLRRAAQELEAIEPRLDEAAAVAARRAQYALRRYADVVEAVARWQMTSGHPGLVAAGSSPGQSGDAPQGADTVLTALTAHAPLQGPRWLLEAWEEFEASQSPQAARRLAEHLHRLGQADHAAAARVRAVLQQYTRGANVRVVVAQELLSRMLPQPSEEREPVCDCILGYPVQGTSRRQTRLEVRFARHPLRGAAAGYLELLASGTVEADTYSRSAWVTTFTRSEAAFTVRQPLELDPRGLRLAGVPEVHVQSRAQLRDVQSELDAVPLLGSVVRTLAAEQYEQLRNDAEAEARRKLEGRVRQVFQQEAPRAVQQANEHLAAYVLEPLRELGLEPRDAWFEASEQRLAIRVRLAADEQLAANTPRPRALATSLASLQVHQSAVNNLVERLELAGATFTPEQLRQHLGRRWPALQHLAAADGSDQTHDVTVSFAAADPVAICCEGGRLRVELNLDELRADGERWTNIAVHVYYRPQWQGAAVKLVRDGPIHLLRGGTTFRSQLALRGIFSRVFHKDQAVSIGPPSDSDDPRWAGLAVTQFVLDDGWLGVALGPLHAAPAMLGRGNDRHVELRR